MNRLTQILDETDEADIGYAWLEKLLFGDRQTNWYNNYNLVYFDSSKPYLYDILYLFCSLIAHWTEEELQEYIDSYLKETNR